MELQEDKKNKKEISAEKTEGLFSVLNKEEFHELSSFFDLLARFDYEDKQTEKLVLNSDSLVSAPRGSEFGTNSLK